MFSSLQLAAATATGGSHSGMVQRTNTASSVAIRLAVTAATKVQHGVDYVRAFFVLSLFMILTFACMDTYLNLKYPVNVSVEENPMARWLLQVSNNNLVLFMAVKWLGTALVLGFLEVFYQRRRDMALTTSVTVALCVTSMLVYMIT